MAGGACMAKGGMHGEGVACVTEGRVWQRGHAWQGRVVHGKGGGDACRRDGH